MDKYEEGDRLFLFGFSRGAYTIRALAGMFHNCGLLEPDRDNLLPNAMKVYERVTAKQERRAGVVHYNRGCPHSSLGPGITEGGALSSVSAEGRPHISARSSSHRQAGLRQAAS